MNGTPIPTRKRPCEECPWAKTTEPGQFSAERYEALRATTGSPGREAPMGAPMFQCHKSTDRDPMPCAGWLAAVGYFSMTVRINLMVGALDREAVVPGEDWPDLYEDYGALCAVHAPSLPSVPSGSCSSTRTTA